MRLATIAVLFAITVSACMADEVAAAEVAAPAKSARMAEPQRAQNRDGAHHHHHEHHPIQYDAAPAPAYAAQPAAAPAYAAQPAPAPVAYAAPAAPAYDAAPAPQVYEAAPAAPAYDAAPAAPAYDAAPAPAYSTPAHQGYYYYYYPLKQEKVKLKLPKLPKLPSLPSLPSLRLPEYIGKDGGFTTVKSFGAAAAAAAVVATGLFLSMPIIGLGAGRRSFNSLWESEYFTRENMNVLAEFILNSIDSYKEQLKN